MPFPSTIPPLHRKYWLVSLLAVVMIAAGVAWLWWPSADNPYYQGRRLSSYLKDLPLRIWATDTKIVVPLESPKPGEISAAEYEAWQARFELRREQAVAAFVALEEKSFPLLLDYLSATNSFFDQTPRFAPDFMKPWFRKIGFATVPSRAYVNRCRAAYVVEQLHQHGCDISPLILELRALAEVPHWHASETAETLLWYLDPQVSQVPQTNANHTTR